MAGALDAGIEAAARANFAAQQVMRLVGASIVEMAPGRVVLGFGYRKELSQQNGFVHAGIAATVADSAGGYAAFTLMPPGSDVLTTDYQMRFLAPARGERFEATAQVVKAGRTLTVCELRVEAIEGTRRTLCCYGTQTLVRMPGPDSTR